jgi:hypothetical protein
MGCSSFSGQWQLGIAFGCSGFFGGHDTLTDATLSVGKRVSQPWLVLGSLVVVFLSIFFVLGQGVRGA